MDGMIRDIYNGHRVNMVYSTLAAKHALRRKKRHETSLIQTQEQINTLDNQIFQVEDANITKTTFQAMKQAGTALKSIHGGLTVTKVEQAMYVLYSCLVLPT